MVVVAVVVRQRLSRHYQARMHFLLARLIMCHLVHLALTHCLRFFFFSIFFIVCSSAAPDFLLESHDLASLDDDNSTCYMSKPLVS